MIVSIIYFILMLSIIVMVHEFGHFFFAKLFGIYVYEFSLGMGPKIWSKKDKKGETAYSIRAIPIGGFVQLAGEGMEDDKNLPKERLLQSKPVWQRFLVMFFGAGNNFILALIVLFFMGLIAGVPDISNVVYDVVDGSPMQQAGIMKGDEIIRINGNRIKTLDDLQLYLHISKGETEFVVLRDGDKHTFKVTRLEEEEMNKRGYSFGIEYNQEREEGFGKSVVYAFEKFYSIIRQMALTLKELFTGGVSVSELSGPLGIYSAVDQTKETGISNLIMLLALLSVNVGFMNLIPFPAFDGGRILFLFIEKIKGSPVKAETENLIHSIGFFMLIALIIFVTYNDIVRLIKSIF